MYEPGYRPVLLVTSILDEINFSHFRNRKLRRKDLELTSKAAAMTIRVEVPGQRETRRDASSGPRLEGFAPLSPIDGGAPVYPARPLRASNLSPNNHNHHVHVHSNASRPLPPDQYS